MEAEDGRVGFSGSPGLDDRPKLTPGSVTAGRKEAEKSSVTPDVIRTASYFTSAEAPKFPTSIEGIDGVEADSFGVLNQD
ncbi:hypothetical protein E4U53_005572 [Claviceps sorghi]|nr:hypothetical protein E4U53_005572 [Claviceps sorghi]